MSTEHRLIDKYQGHIIPEMVTIQDQPSLPFWFTLCILTAIGSFSFTAWLVG